MKLVGNSVELSASDLVGFLNCPHLSALDRAVAKGALPKPKVWDPLLEILRERGAAHEQNYIEHLRKAGLEVARIDGVDVTQQEIAQTLAAMTKGTAVIAQGALEHGGWVGRADILRRVEVASALGAWSYEAIDTKLARETKAGAVLQLCLYSDLLAQAQGIAPEHMYVVVPWSDFEPQKYRFADYAAYYRKVKRALLQFLADKQDEQTYPDPKEHCDICRWRVDCDKRRRADDHLCLVANISKLQISELKQRKIPGARVGTVDKFQGQEAPIAIYSTATSSHADAPRGMEFLYSLNRLNVATSRAKCLSIMISSPRIFEAECRTPRQIQLANAFCGFLEMARTLSL